MICKHCETIYDKLKDTHTSGKDYGYCSRKCMDEGKPPCTRCGQPVIRHLGEHNSQFSKRLLCSTDCRDSHLHEKQKQWMSDPVASSEWRKNYSKTMRERGHYKANSKRMKDFFKTHEGDEYKAMLRKGRLGQKLPPHVKAKMLKGLEVYWDSPEGMALRDAISLRRTDGLHETPEGPGWTKQASKMRKRDGKCILCGATRSESHRRALDVHHIIPRRKFGYIPGQNHNYLFANHPSNLICVCVSCHQTIEYHPELLPEEYRNRAQQIWEMFTQSINSPGGEE